MKKIVVLTGAGISAESGIKTFRDADGLWEGHDVMEVASIEGWRKNPTLMLDFYNQRRKQLAEVFPNVAHKTLKELEEYFEVTIITQNVDNLHERAGSQRIIHLHGELTKMRTENSSADIFESPLEIKMGDLGNDGSQLRPHIVWFGEPVPEMNYAIEKVQNADILVVIGTSMQVYPAASLVDFVKKDAPIYYIDKKPAQIYLPDNPLEIWNMSATKGVKKLYETLTKNII